MLQAKFQEHRSSGSGEDFYHMQALRPSWSCDLDHLDINFGYAFPRMFHMKLAH